MASRDAIYIEYKGIQEQMKGISPKLSTYQVLSQKLKKLDDELGGHGNSAIYAIRQNKAMVVAPIGYTTNEHTLVHNHVVKKKKKALVIETIKINKKIKKEKKEAKAIRKKVKKTKKDAMDQVALIKFYEEAIARGLDESKKIKWTKKLAKIKLYYGS